MKPLAIPSPTPLCNSRRTGLWVWRALARCLPLLCMALLALGGSRINAQQAPSQSEPPNPTELVAAPDTLRMRAGQSPIDLGGSAGYWLGSDPSLRVEQVVQRQQEAARQGQALFKPYTPGAIKIIDEQVLWLYFEAVSESAGTPWYLELALPQVDDARLYFQAANGQWNELRVGDKVMLHDWPIASRTPLFALSGQADKPTRYYLRVQHQRAPFAAPLRIHSAASLMEQRESEHFLMGCFVGLAALLAIVAAIEGYNQREHAFGIFALFIAVLTLAQLVQTGEGAYHVWPQALAWRSRADFLMPTVSLAAAVWLLRESVMRQQPWPVLDTAVMGTTAIALAVAAFDALWPSTWGFLLTNSATLVALVLILVLLWRALISQDIHTRRMGWGFVPIMLGSLVHLLPNLGLLSTGWLSQNAPIVGLVLSAPLLLYALYARSAQRRLARVRVAALMQTDPLTGLANDRALAQNLHGALMRAQRFRHEFGLLLVELDNRDWLAQNHGRLMGDRATLLLATRLAGVARNVDTSARLQDNMFALLMDGPLSPAQVSNAAAQIVSRALRPSDQLPVGASLKVQVTAALLPDEQLQAWGEDANACLNWLMSQTATAQGLQAQPIRQVNF
jgi:two-component system, sensor histidine kinase LadS